MGIAGVLPNSNNLAAESKLKLLAAARLPAVPSPVPKLDSLSTFTKNQHAQPVELSDEALAQVSKLKARDTQVRNLTHFALMHTHMHCMSYCVSHILD